MSAFRFQWVRAMMVVGLTLPGGLAPAGPASPLDFSMASARSYRFVGYDEVLEVADLNGDGLTDAAASGYWAEGLDVLLNRGGWRMSRPIVSPTTLLARALAFGDLNEDGH